MTEQYRALLEAALFVSGRQLSIEDLARLCNSGNIGAVRTAMEDLQKEYQERNTGIEITESNGQYAMRVKKEHEAGVMHLVPETDMQPAVLKTLALIAYSQPIKQSEIIKQRGNGAYKYIKKLKDQELIETHKSSRTKVITVTNKFKDYFQIQDMKELKEKIPEALVKEEPNPEPAPEENTEE